MILTTPYYAFNLLNDESVGGLIGLVPAYLRNRILFSMCTPGAFAVLSSVDAIFEN